MTVYKTPAQPHRCEFIEKKSRFIIYTEQVNDENEFKAFLTRTKQQYPDAGHHCYGFRIGPSSSAKRGFSDDGEPSGTAGMPILNVIDHSEFSDIAIIVVRYFGGIKLGTGGLTRAYSQAAKLAIEQLPYRFFEKKVQIRIQCDFSEENQVRHLLAQNQGEIKEVNYEAGVNIHAQLSEIALTQLREHNLAISSEPDS